jgi:hypothetical protein
MITSINKPILFELLYRIWIDNENLNDIDQYIRILIKDLKMIEAADIASLNPENFKKWLEEEWKRFLCYRNRQNSEP